MDAIMIAVTVVGDLGVVWILLAGIFISMKKYRKWGFLLMGVLFVNYIGSELILKLIIARPRPFIVNSDIDLLIKPPEGYSMPSSHAVSSFSAFWTAKRASNKIGIVCLVLACMVAFSRVYLYVHYFTDIICGAVLGIAWAQLTYEIARRKGWIQIHDNLKRS